MNYGVFSSVFGNDKIEVAAKRMREAGFTATHFVPFNVEGKFIDPLKVSERTIRRFAKAFEAEGIEVVSVGAWGRYISPDPAEAVGALETAKAWIRLAPLFGAKYVVNEVGSKHPTHNWTDVPANHTKKTWNEVVKVYRELADYAADYGITVAVEPHFAQAIRDAGDLRRLLDDVKRPNLKIVFDPANSVTKDNQGSIEEALSEFIRLLGPEIVLAHAKDASIREDGYTDFVPAGSGVLPYRKYLNVLESNGYQGPLLLEYVDETTVGPALNFLKEQDMPPYLIPLFRADPALFANATQALDIVHAPEGALELKYRLLLSMVADALTRHPAGAIACGREALEAGATKEQVTEAIRVIYTAGGLPSLIENFDLYSEVILK